VHAVSILRELNRGNEQAPLLILRDTLMLARVVKRVSVSGTVANIMTRFLAALANEARWQVVQTTTLIEVLAASCCREAESTTVTTSRLS